MEASTAMGEAPAHGGVTGYGDGTCHGGGTGRKYGISGVIAGR